MKWLILSVISVAILMGAIATAAEPTLSWTSDGVVVCETTSLANLEFPFPQLTNDGADGAIIIWQDKRSGNYDIYAQRVDSSGTIQWTENGVAICDAGGDQKIDPPTEDNYPYLNLICPDDSGGAIIVWKDGRAGNWDLYAQRVNSSGAVQWAEDGVAVCTDGSDQEMPQITPDGSGGAIIVWQDDRSGNYDIYSQRIDSNGNALWTGDGAAVCANASGQTDPQLLADGSGGAVFTWHDKRSAAFNIYAQKFDANGAGQWTENGIAVSEETTGNQWFPVIISDDSSGAIVTWNDTRRAQESGYNLDFSIFTQRLDSDGQRLWTSGGDYDGIAITYKTGRQEDAVQVTDTEGGAIIAWDDDPTENVDPPSSNFNIYAQRVNSAGATQWTDGGVAICTEDDEQSFPEMVVDGSGGAILVWHDKRTGEYDVYTQQINSVGEVQWTADGVAVCDATGEQAFPRITTGASGEAIAAWQDHRGDSWGIYAQKIATSTPSSAGGCSLTPRVLPRIPDN